MILVKISITLALNLCVFVLCHVRNIPIIRKFPISRAAADVIEKFFVNQKIPFDIYILGEKTTTYNDIINEIEMENRGEYHTKIKWIQDAEMIESIEFNQSAVIFARNKFLIEFNEKAKLTNDYAKKLKFLHICIGKCVVKAKISLDFHVAPIEQFQYFLIRLENKIYLQTIVWFAENQCNMHARNILNIFHIKTLKWYKMLENHEKFQNFHGCLIKYESSRMLTIFNKVEKNFEN